MSKKFYGEGRLPGDNAEANSWTGDWEKAAEGSLQPPQSEVEMQVNLALKHVSPASITGWQRAAVQRPTPRPDGSMAIVDFHTLEVSHRGGKPVTMCFTDANKAATADRIVSDMWTGANRNLETRMPRAAKL